MSRELDALVEKHIFGRDPSYYDCPHFDEKGRMLSFCICPEMPHRSSDPTSAWPIIDHLTAELLLTFRIQITKPGEATVECWGPYSAPLTESGPVAEAICMCGLAAMGVDVVKELAAQG